MKAVCLVDTSIFCELLAIPQKCKEPQKYQEQVGEKITAGEALLLPMATILETGNHIARHGDGRQRRQAAQRFVDQVQKALGGDSPFTPTPLPEPEALRDWLQEFPDRAMQGMGLGDLSIVHEYERQRALHKKRRVYIWSLDRHLKSYA